MNAIRALARRVLLALLFAAGALIAGAAPAQALSGGPEIPVNAFTADIQEAGDLDSTPGGGFVAVWQSYEQDGWGYGVYARRFDAAGVPLGGEIPVSATTLANQLSPAITVEAGGGFTVVWQGDIQDGSGYGIFARRFGPSGVPLTAEIQVNTTTALDQQRPDVDSDPTGFTVSWESEGQDGDLRGVFARRFNPAGAPLTAEIPVNTTTPDRQLESRVAADGGGGFLVTWASYGQDGSGYGVVARRFGADGAPLSAEIPVNTSVALDQRNAAVAAGVDGFVLAWASIGHDGSAYGVVARRLDAAGVPLTAELPVNLTTDNSQDRPAVLVDGDGFTVAWSSYEQDGDESGIFARRFGPAGNGLGGEIPINTTTAAAQQSPALASDGAGGFTALWDSQGQDGDEAGVFARRFAEPAPPPSPPPATLAAPLAAPPARSGSVPRCKGKRATIVARGRFTKGTRKRDVIVGGGRRDVIRGRGGNDLICGRGGNDLLLGGAGRDALHGQGGRDTLRGQGARDRLFGGGGRDRLFGGRGADRLFGGAGRDELRGGRGRDRERG